MQIMAKTGKPVPSADEVMFLKGDSEYLEARIKEEMVVTETEKENNSTDINSIKVCFMFCFFVITRLLGSIFKF